ncbi:MAG: hypothetical protein JXR48_14115 [Candidatus Delongbacteria bacterium]|nr:hypothetical protein [Candidatus Delongbacteria bacterium]MBN2836090.1 hypothetical protein [Candidatus Delongbacteria bacterium]
MKKLFTTLAVLLAIGAGFQSCKTTEASTKKIEEITPVKAKGELTEKEINDLRMKQSMANQKVKNQQYRDALNYYEEILPQDLDFKYLAQVNIKKVAESYEGLNIQDSAIMYYEKYLTVKPDDKTSLQKLDFYYTDANQYDKAIELMTSLQAIDPENSEYILKIAGYYIKMAQMEFEHNGEDSETGAEYEEKALESYEEYQDKSGDESYSNLITQLTAKYKSSAELKVKYEEALKREPEDVTTMLKLSKIYISENNNTGAAKLLDKVVQIDPENKSAIKMLLRIFKDDEKRAVPLFKKAMQFEPNNENYNLSLSKIYLSNKDYVSSRNEVVSALRKNPNNKKIYRQWASIYQQSVTCASSIGYKDKLVLTIAYGLLKKGGYDSDANRMASNEQTPTKVDYFTNKSITKPDGKCYEWIDQNWDEFKYIDEYIARFK